MAKASHRKSPKKVAAGRRLWAARLKKYGSKAAAVAALQRARKAALRRGGGKRKKTRTGHKSAKKVAQGKRLYRMMCARHGGKAGLAAYLKRRRKASKRR